MSATRQTQVDKRDDKTGELLQKFSTFAKIRRVLVYVHRFVEVTIRTAVPKGSLTVEELMHSKLRFLKWSQLHIDVPCLDDKLIFKTDEEELIRAHSRLENVTILPKDMGNPILLPRDH